MDLSSLNKEQKEAVLYNDGPLLIIAGAGSGKTRVITYKIANLIDNGIYPGSILAITFTNKAADEMRDRVIELIGIRAKNCFISTFHKFCGRVLRIYIENIGYRNDFSIYDTDDVKSLLSRIIKDLGYDDKKIKAKAVASKISYCKNHGLDIEEYCSSKKPTDIDLAMTECAKEYEKRMFENNAIDFDDMLLLCVRVLKEVPEALKALQNKFKYILIDEYQDTNLVQFEIIKLLLKDSDNLLTVVGDDDQSIYKFRGADISNILEFEDSFPGAKVIKLTQNYRSTNNILNVANCIIKNNEGRKGKTLWSSNGDGDIVKFTEYEDDTKEAKEIIKKISKDREYKNIAILYRTNAQSRKFEEMCVNLGVPYQLVGGVNFYQRKEIKDVLAYLHLLVNPSDTNSLFRIINVPKRGIGGVTLDKVLKYAGDNNLLPLNAIFDYDKIDLTARAKNSLKSFVDFILMLKSESSIDNIIDKIVKLGYEDYLKDEYGNEEAMERMQNIIELKDKATSFIKTYPEFIENDILKDLAKNVSSETILNDFLNEVSLVADVDRLNSVDDKLTLMTLHGSKGLEYDTVYMTGMNEFVFPSYMAILDGGKDEVEEERRLCYVGVTRAKKHLYLSAARRMMRNGNYQSFDVSRFIDEIDSDLIEKNELPTLNNYFDGDYSNRDFNSRRYSNNFTNYGYSNKKYGALDYSNSNNKHDRNNTNFKSMNDIFDIPGFKNYGRKK